MEPSIYEEDYMLINEQEEDIDGAYQRYVDEQLWEEHE